MTKPSARHLSCLSASPWPWKNREVPESARTTVPPHASREQSERVALILLFTYRLFPLHAHIVLCTW